MKILSLIALCLASALTTFCGQTSTPESKTKAIACSSISVSSTAVAKQGAKYTISFGSVSAGTFDSSASATAAIATVKAYRPTSICQIDGSSFFYFQSNFAAPTSASAGERCETFNGLTVAPGAGDFVVKAGNVQVRASSQATAQQIKTIVSNLGFNVACVAGGSQDFIFWKKSSTNNPDVGTPGVPGRPTPQPGCRPVVTKENCVGRGFCSHEENGFTVIGSWDQCPGTQDVTRCGNAETKRGRCEISSITN